MCIDVYRRGGATEHEMQHPDSPTWCIHCGTFDDYCDDLPCTAERSGEFDSRKNENFKRMAEELFGKPRCESIFNGPSTYRCELEAGHGGQHYSTCHNPEFSQKW